MAWGDFVQTLQLAVLFVLAGYLFVQVGFPPPPSPLLTPSPFPNLEQFSEECSEFQHCRILMAIQHCIAISTFMLAMLV
jgi:hypothetical protein